jgi:hypothetical protein
MNAVKRQKVSVNNLHIGKTDRLIVMMIRLVGMNHHAGISRPVGTNLHVMKDHLTLMNIPVLMKGLKK